ncbi:MAG: polymerase [Peptococcaceae bacterium]|nr:polymerase [Peptococcaceae bacterium]
MTKFIHMINNSLVFQLVTSSLKTLDKYKEKSSLIRFLTTPPLYTKDAFLKKSGLYSLLSKALSTMARPFTAAGAFFDTYRPYSKISGLKLPKAAQDSSSWRTLSGIRVESALWLMIFYPIIDFFLRKIPSLAFLSSGWDELLMVAILLAWPVQMAFRDRLHYRYTPVDLPILIYIGITLFLFFMRSWNLSLAMEGTRVYLEYLIWFFIGSNLLQNKKQFYALMKGIALVALIVAAYGIFQQITGIETPAEWVDKAEAGIQTRVFSIVVSPNVLGSLLIPFIMITGGQLLSSHKRWERWAWLGVLGVLATCMIFTYSRGAWLALGLAALIFCLLYNPRLIFLAIIGAFAAIKLVPGIGSRFSYLFSSAYINSSQRGGRLALWQAALEKFKHDPIFGSGFGTFGGAVAARRVPDGFYVDNFFLKTLAEAGIIGLMAFVWLLFSLIRSGWAAFKSIRDPDLKIMAGAILAGLIGVAAHNGVENIFEVPMMASYFWLLAGMLLALPMIEKTPEK